MRLTIDIDTSEITAEDRRVLMALAGHDAGELRITHVDEPATTPATPAPPLPVPVPPAFASKLGEAVAQFSPRGSGSEARLPFAQQAGVRTSSTMPDDDGAELESELVDAMAGEELGPNADRGDADVRAPDVELPEVSRMTETARIPRESVEQDPAPHPQDRVRAAILGTVDAPVRHTSP